MPQPTEKPDTPELGIGPPTDARLIVEMPDDGRAKVVAGLLERGVLSAASAVAVGIDNAVDITSLVNRGWITQPTFHMSA